MDRPELSEFLYDPDTKEGVVFYLLPAISVGKIGFVNIGNTSWLETQDQVCRVQKGRWHWPWQRISEPAPQSSRRWLFLVLSGGGFGAPDIKYCEETLCQIISEPSNTWSNLALVFAGVYGVWCRGIQSNLG